MAWEENSCICLHMQLIAILSRIGVLSYKDKSSEIYENGFVTASKVYLQDGGFYTTRKNGCNELTYPDGSVFKANKPNGLILHKSKRIRDASRYTSKKISLKLLFLSDIFLFPFVRQQVTVLA